MAIVCISWESAHLHGEAWISHHRLRHRIFVERQGWNLPSHNGLEYDQFDTPAATYVLWLDDRHQTRGVTRLIPTTRPYMIQSLWPELIRGPLPQSATIWEASRFGCDRDVDADTRRRVVAELICGCQEFGIANGIAKYIGVMPISIFHHVIGLAGCRVTRLGPTIQMQRQEIGAAYVDVCQTTLAAVRTRCAVRGPVVHPQLPLVA